MDDEDLTIYCSWNEVIEHICVNPMKKMELLDKGPDLVELSILCRNCMEFQKFKALRSILSELRILRVTGFQS